MNTYDYNISDIVNKYSRHVAMLSDKLGYICSESPRGVKQHFPVAGEKTE